MKFDLVLYFFQANGYAEFSKYYFMDQPVEDLLLLMAILVPLAIILWVVNHFPAEPPDFSERRMKATYLYEKQKSLYSPTELEFRELLNQIVGESYIVYYKVSLVDLLRVKSALNRNASHDARNRLQNRHVDYVVCRETDHSIVLIVELKKSSTDRMRDDFLVAAVGAAQIPLVRIPAKKPYTVELVRYQLKNHLDLFC